MISLISIFAFASEYAFSNETEFTPIVSYNCYLKKNCDLFKKAENEFSLRDIIFERADKSNVDEMYEIFYDTNKSLTIPVKKYEDIKDCIDFFTAENPILLQDISLQNTSFITVISPLDDYKAMVSYSQQLYHKFGFINVVVGDDESGYHVYNPLDKLLYGFDGTLFELSRVAEGRMMRKSFEEMRESDAISFIVMDSDPSMEVRESMSELKAMFPNVEFIIPDNATISDINLLTNETGFDFSLMHASLGLFSNLNYKTVIPPSPTPTVPAPTPQYTPHPSSSSTFNWESEIPSYKQYYKSEHARTYYRDYSSDYDYLDYYDWGRRYYYSMYDPYYWYMNSNYFDKMGNFIGDPYSFFIMTKRDTYYDWADTYHYRGRMCSFVAELEYDENGSYVNRTVFVTSDHYSKIASGMRSSHFQNTTDVIMKGLATVKKVVPMNSLSNNIAKWLVERQKDIKKWNEIRQYVDDFKSEYVTFLNSESYTKFIGGKYDSAILYMDNSDEAKAMLRNFIAAAEKAQIVGGKLTDLKFGVINTVYNRISNYMPFRSVSLSFSVKPPVVYVTPQVWYKFIPILAKNRDDVEKLLSDYMYRPRFNSTRDAMNEFFGEGWNNSDYSIVDVVSRKYQSPGKNDSYTRSPSGDVFNVNNMFYWNIKLL